MYVYSINSQKLENLHLDEFYDGEFIGEVTFQKFPIFDRSNDVTKYELGAKRAQMYIYSINSQKLENLHLDEFYDAEFTGEVTFRNFQNLTAPTT